MYPSTVCFSKYGLKAANIDSDMAKITTPLKRHWYGLVYCNILLNNRMSNAFAFIFYAEFKSVFGAISCFCFNIFIFFH
jgi:hypothetical protein